MYKLSSIKNSTRVTEEVQNLAILGIKHNVLIGNEVTSYDMLLQLLKPYDRGIDISDVDLATKLVKYNLNYMDVNIDNLAQFELQNEINCNLKLINELKTTGKCSKRINTCFYVKNSNVNLYFFISNNSISDDDLRKLNDKALFKLLHKALPTGCKFESGELTNLTLENIKF